MATKPITELKDELRDQDVYVIAAGPSAGFIEPSFFDNKPCIGVNEVWRHFNVDYMVYKELNRGYVPDAATLIVAKHKTGCLKFEENQIADGYIFEHADNQLTEIDLSVIGTDKIVVSFSTITSAVHIAAYMGAANVILVGHDCGKLDGRANMNGYPEPKYENYDNFLASIEPQTIAVREKLKEIYSCNIYSLNPFVNFGLEGHIYAQIERKVAA
jgi:hypothetical protein